jgi:hypothetical protein
MLNAVLENLPKDFIGNLTTILPPRKLASLVSSIPMVLDKLYFVCK